MDGGVKGQMVGGHSGGNDMLLEQIALICPSMQRHTQSAYEDRGMDINSNVKVNTANFTDHKVCRRVVAIPSSIHTILNSNAYGVDYESSLRISARFINPADRG